jgi:hypothetical protein
MAQSIKTDSEVRVLYSSFLLEDLIQHKKQFFTSVFSKQQNPAKLNSSILLRHYGLIQQGFNEKHFDLIVKHFVQELKDSWVNAVAIQDAVSILNSGRPVFESSDQNKEEKPEKKAVSKKKKNTHNTHSIHTTRRLLGIVVK